MKLSSKSNVLLKSLFGLSAATLAVSAVVWAQGGIPQRPDLTKMKVKHEVDDLYLTTKVGSFKILPRGDALPNGTLIMSFTGSTLISELHGTVTPQGNIRREYNERKRNKQVWFGTGKLIIKGDFASVQWFGRDLTAEFHGNGLFRLYGEFDKELNTGWYWYDKATKKYWGNYGTTVVVPEQNAAGGAMSREEFNKGKGKKGGS